MGHGAESSRYALPIIVTGAWRSIVSCCLKSTSVLASCVLATALYLAQRQGDRAKSHEERAKSLPQWGPPSLAWESFVRHSGAYQRLTDSMTHGHKACNDSE